MWLDLMPLALLNPPSRLRTLGHTLINGAGCLLLIGLFGQVAVAAVSGVMSPAGSAPHATSLALLYPALPTWWVPEGPLGFVFCTTTLGVGIVLSSVANKVQRLMY